MADQPELMNLGWEAGTKELQQSGDYFATQPNDLMVELELEKQLFSTAMLFYNKEVNEPYLKLAVISTLENSIGILIKYRTAIRPIGKNKDVNLIDEIKGQIHLFQISGAINKGELWKIYNTERFQILRALGQDVGFSKNRKGQFSWNQTKDNVKKKIIERGDIDD